MSLLGPDAQPISSAPAPDPEPVEPAAPTQVVCAFMVYQLPTGRWVASDDFSQSIIAMRGISPDDLISGASNVVAEVTARKAADMAATTTIQTQLAMARQAQQAQAAQQMSPEEQRAAAAAMRGNIPPAFRR
jgi:hypothetical protein